MNDKDYIITLDDNREYALVSSMIYLDKKYVYLVDMDNHENVIFGELTNDTVKIIEDGELLAKVIDEFKKLEENNGEERS